MENGTTFLVIHQSNLYGSSSAVLESRRFQLEVKIRSQYLRRRCLLLLVDDVCAGGTTSADGARRATTGRHNADRNDAIDARRSSEGLGAGRRRRRVDWRDGDQQRCGTAQLRRRRQPLVERLAGRAAASAARLLASATLETQVPLQPAATRRLGTLAAASSQVWFARPLVLQPSHATVCICTLHSPQIGLSVAKMQKKRDFLKTKQFRAMVSIDDL